MDKNEPAFPVIDPQGNVYPGLTKREYFAIHAPEPSEGDINLQLSIDRSRNPHNDPHKPRLRSVLEIKTSLRFALADAMIAASKESANEDR